MRGGLILLCVLMAVLVGSPVPSDAQEAWCLANPANCVCSEPLQDTLAQYSVVSTTQNADTSWNTYMVR